MKRVWSYISATFWGLHHSSINFRCCKISTVLSAHFIQVLCLFFCFWLSYGDMSDFIRKILIFGHSFVRRLPDDLVKCFDSRAKQNFNLAEELARFCRDTLKIKVVVVCQVINRVPPRRIWLLIIWLLSYGSTCV